MPLAAEDADPDLVRLLEHGDHVGVSVHRLDVGHAQKRSEPRAEALQIAKGKFLIAEKDHLMPCERGFHLRESCLVQSRCHVDPGDLGADDRAKGNHFELGCCHAHSLESNLI